MLLYLEPNHSFTPIVILQGSSSNMDFRGFMIQGRARADDSPVGTFGNGTNYRYACDGNVRFCPLNMQHAIVITLCRLLPLTSVELKKLQLL